MPKIDEHISGEFNNLAGPIHLPGCVGADLPDAITIDQVKFRSIF